MAHVEALREGETFGSHVGPDGEERTFTVASPCDEKNAGRWLCVTHDTGFANQFQKDTHIMSGKHRLVWVCFEHGPEQP